MPETVLRRLTGQKNTFNKMVHSMQNARMSKALMKWSVWQSSRMQKAIFMVLAMVVTPGALAGEADSSANSDDLITGVVIDQTITSVAHEFYRNFTATWNNLPCADSRVLTIYERPSARWGSLVWIVYDHGILYRAFLSPTGARMQSTAENAAQLVCQRSVSMDASKALFVDPDLARDEF